jgi:hypothetical protein
MLGDPTWREDGRGASFSSSLLQGGALSWYKAYSQIPLQEPLILSQLLNSLPKGQIHPGWERKKWEGQKSYHAPPYASHIGKPHQCHQSALHLLIVWVWNSEQGISGLVPELGNESRPWHLWAGWTSYSHTASPSLCVLDYKIIIIIYLPQWERGDSMNY